MPRAAPQTPDGRSLPLMAVDRRPTGQSHQRRSPGPSGPHRPCATDAERLQGLRKRLASTENIGTIKSISSAASELALIAPEGILESIGDLIDRANDKLKSLGVAPKAANGRRKRPVSLDNEIADDEEGRPISVKKGDRLLVKLREIHGESRPDIPPRLLEARAVVAGPLPP
jgi:hypothetical protein